MRITAKEYKALKTGKKIEPLEDDDAEIFVKFLENSWIKYFSHLPLSTRTPYKSVRAKNKRMGVKGWIPDYLITLPISYTWLKKRKLIFIEMKRRKGGVVSEKQKEWLKILAECEGIETYVTRGLAEAKQVIENYYFNKKKD